LLDHYVMMCDLLKAFIFWISIWATGLFYITLWLFVFLDIAKTTVW